MNAGTITDRVLDILATTLDIDRSQLAPDTDLREDLELDSLDMTALAIELEDAFGELDPSDMDGLRSIRDVVAFIEKRFGDA